MKILKAGDEISCNYCGANSFLEKKTIMDGWTKSGEVLACSSCSKVLQNNTLGEEDLSVNEKDEKKKKASLDKLSSLLGTEQIKKPTIIITNEEKVFCRDCKHYISHPFRDRCSLHQIEVDPMSDCESFEKVDPVQMAGIVRNNRWLK